MSRKNKQEETPQKRKIKEKFVEKREEEIKVKPLVALNKKQKQYINLINTKEMIIATGFAGTAKTYIPVVIACDWFRMGKIDKIVFTRPNISNSKSLGFMAGDLISKMSNWLMPVLQILRERLSPSTLEIALKTGQIEFVPMEVVKGYSAKNAVFIVDEAEDLTIEEAKKIVTRQGENCKMILSGDVTQSELKEKSGLKYLKNLIDKYTLDVGVICFDDVEDIVRSQQCKDWIVAFIKEESVNVK